MTQTIDNQKITLGKAALVFIFIGQAIITYMASSYGTASAIKELEYKTNLQIQKLESKHELYDDKLKALQAAISFRQEAVRPEEPRLKTNTR